MFQPTPLCKGRRHLTATCTCAACFNPRPCARGDERRLHVVGGLPVSTHAPVQGATQDADLRRHRPGVSTHAPVQGATLQTESRPGHLGFQPTPLCKGRPAPTAAWPGPSCFNPRPCARGDFGFRIERQRRRVSTHAPVQGATANGEYVCPSNSFQPTPLCKGRPLLSHLSGTTQLTEAFGTICLGPSNTRPATTAIPGPNSKLSSQLRISWGLLRAYGSRGYTTSGPSGS